jgi:hypothetical protein
MATILKEYNILTQIDSKSVNMNTLNSEIKQFNGITGFNGLERIGDTIKVKGESLLDEQGLDSILKNHTSESISYRLLEDSDPSLNKDFKSINYKTELKSGIYYTPVYNIYTSGKYAGFLNYTEYYRNYVDSTNKGELVLIVEEEYQLDYSDDYYEHSARPVIGRTKTWKWVKTDNSIDTVNIKTKSKIYDTRVKRRIEGERRRQNIIEQLTDNVGMAGVLTGTFNGEIHAHEMLTILLEEHASDFTGWKTSGLGSLVDNINSNTSSTWLNEIVGDNPLTQQVLPWMIGMSYREYFIEKLKGNID